MTDSEEVAPLRAYILLVIDETLLGLNDLTRKMAIIMMIILVTAKVTGAA